MNGVIQEGIEVVEQAETVVENTVFQDNVLQFLYSIDVTLKQILILIMLCIGIRVAWWLVWKIVVKHF